ncbi:MAG: hypothetical protein U1E56_06730 [Bauldia sp.]
MSRSNPWCLRRRLSLALFIAAALAGSGPAVAQRAPAPPGRPATPAPAVAAAPQASRLPVSSAAALADPTVMRCRSLAARRMDPAKDALFTVVENAVALLNLEVVHDAVAVCRAALAAFPAEPRVIVAHANAAEALSLIVFGMRFPDGEEQQLALALGAAGKPDGLTGFLGRSLGFFLGSAYEYGVGTAPDAAAALKWYAAAAAAGDPIAKRELARLSAPR